MRRPLLWALGALLASGCNSSNPVAPDPPQPSGQAVYTLALAANPASLTAGAATPGTVTVTARFASNGQPVRDGTTCAINTDLGSFGTDASGNAVQQRTLTLVGGSAQTDFFPGASPGTAHLRAQIETSIGQLAVQVQPFVEPAFFLTAVQPNIGSAEGGETVVVQGSGFVAPVRVLFGGVVAQVRSVHAQQVQVTTPRSSTPVEAGATRAVDVAVTNAIDQPQPASDTLAGAYTYSGDPVIELPVVLSVVPGTGPNAGGTEVRINGLNFEPPVQVFFGTGSGDSFEGRQATVRDATTTQVRAVTPPATGVGPSFPNRQVNVLVRNVASGTSATGIGVFTYTGEAFLVTGMSPRQGPYTGGTTVTIQGSGFAGSLAVELGGTVQNLTGVTPTQLTVTTVPVAVSGCKPPSGSLKVTRIDTGDTATSPLTFTYTAPVPAIGSLAPAGGPAAGGNAVTLNGGGFEPGVQVQINGVRAVLQSVAPDGSSATVTAPAFTGQFSTETCTAPNGQSGKRQLPKAVDVVATNTATGCTDTSPMSYTYQPASGDCAAAPIADFNFHIGAGRAVSFFDASTGDPTTFRWDFGEPGSGAANASSRRNPTHTYAAAGNYNVMLTVTSAAGSASVLKIVEVP